MRTATPSWSATPSRSSTPSARRAWSKWTRSRTISRVAAGPWSRCPGTPTSPPGPRPRSTVCAPLPDARTWREPPMLRMIVLAQDRVNFTPDFDAIPGAGPVQQLINGIGAFALLLSLVGLTIGGALWGVGSLSSNDHQATVGKRAPLYSVVGAVIVGAAAALVNW